MLAEPEDPRVTAMWRTLAGSEDALTGPGVTIVSSDESQVAPRGWCGVVVLGASAIVATPAECPAAIGEFVRQARTLEALTDPEHLRAMLAVDQLLGPADLQYGAVPPPDRDERVVGPLHADDDHVRSVVAAADEAEVEEAGLGHIARSEGRFVALADGRAVALCGYRPWTGGVAHMGILTLASHRRRGFATLAARASAAHATSAGVVVQWRSRVVNHASRRVGQRIGLTHCGRQLSFRLA